MLKPLRKFSQVFLSNSESIDQVVSHIHKNCTSVFEVGPGGGALVPSLLSYQYQALEKDPRAVDFLKEEYNLDVELGDVLTNDFTGISADLFFSSVPYSITRALLEKLIFIRDQFEDILLILPLPFAKRLGEKSIDQKKMFSFLVERYFEIETLFIIPANHFTPVPKIDSCLVRFSKKDVNSEDYFSYYKYLLKAFQSPRKSLKKAFSNTFFSFTNKRPHELTLNEHLALFKWLLDQKKLT